MARALVPPISVSTVAAAGLFAALDRRALARIEHEGALTAVPRGHVLFQQGAPSRSMHLVCAGRVRVTSADALGRRLLMTVLGPGAVVDLPSVIGGEDCFASGEMQTAGWVLRFEPRLFRGLVERDREFSRHVYKALARNLKECWERGFSNAVKYGRERLAEHLLMEFGVRAPWREPHGPLALNVNRTNIASRTGMAKETVSRLLKGLAKRRCIAINGRAIRILSVKTLAQTAGFTR